MVNCWKLNYWCFSKDQNFLWNKSKLFGLSKPSSKAFVDFKNQLNLDCLIVGNVYYNCKNNFNDDSILPLVSLEPKNWTWYSKVSHPIFCWWVNSCCPLTTCCNTNTHKSWYKLTGCLTYHPWIIIPKFRMVLFSSRLTCCLTRLTWLIQTLFLPADWNLDNIFALTKN